MSLFRKRAHQGAALSRRQATRRQGLLEDEQGPAQGRCRSPELVQGATKGEATRPPTVPLPRAAVAHRKRSVSTKGGGCPSAKGARPGRWPCGCRSFRAIRPGAKETFAERRKATSTPFWPTALRGTCRADARGLELTAWLCPDSVREPRRSGNESVQMRGIRVSYLDACVATSGSGHGSGCFGGPV
jgi:hypothetical protein